jgi:uncharacterized coiled-coil DUF342 family protein
MIQQLSHTQVMELWEELEALRTENAELKKLLGFAKETDVEQEKCIAKLKQEREAYKEEIDWAVERIQELEAALKPFAEKTWQKKEDWDRAKAALNDPSSEAEKEGE